MEMKIGRDDIMVNYDDGSLYEAIDLHNEHVEKMLDLGKLLFDRFNYADQVIDAFIDVFNSAAGTAILLCCEGNSMEDDPVWMVTEDFHVVRKEEE